jgi:hypothetical protein
MLKNGQQKTPIAGARRFIKFGRMTSYSTIDPILSAWAVKHHLQVFTEYQDEEVRYVIFQRDGERKADLWIERPPTAGVGLHLAEWSKRRRDAIKRSDIQSDVDPLESDLDILVATAASW